MEDYLDISLIFVGQRPLLGVLIFFLLLAKINNNNLLQSVMEKGGRTSCSVKNSRTFTRTMWRVKQCKTVKQVVRG